MERGVKTVYGGGFRKPSWYAFWINHGFPNTFSALGKEHMVHRRRITSVYAKSYIQRDRHVLKIIHTLFGRLSPQICESARTGKPIDVLRLNMAYGLDFVSAFIFGIPQGTNFLQDLQARDHWLSGYLKSHPNEHMFWLLEMHGLRRWARVFGVKLVPDWIWEARRNLDQWALRMVDNTEEAIGMKSVNDTPDGEFPVVYNQLKLALAQERHMKGIDLTLGPPAEERLQLASECLDHIGRLTLLPAL
ncbi:MAG: hypothetical protein Q9163_004856 [Psora crenata]